MIAEDLKQLSTPQLLSLMDECESEHMTHQVPNNVLAQLDAGGYHILQRHSIHQFDIDFVRARAMFKLLGQTEGSDLYFVDVTMDAWDRLPTFEEIDI